MNERNYKKIIIKKECHLKKKTIQCDLCQKYFSTKNGLTGHMYSHFPQDYLTCRGCGGTKPSYEKYKKHMRECGELKNKTPNIQNRYAFKCDLCKKNFFSKDGIRQHIYSHFPKEYLTCIGCKTTSRSYCLFKTHKLECKNFNKIKESHLEKNTLKCDLCKRNFAKKSGLKQHIYSHFPEYFLTCKGCKKTLKSYDGYQKHVRDCKKCEIKKPVILNQNIHECVLCHKNYVSKEGLRQHMFSHSPEEYLTCEGCGITTHTPWLHRLHMLDCKKLKKQETTNVNQSAFKCDWCMKNLSSESALKRHIYTHFPIDQICRGCKEAFKTVRSYNTHVHNCPVLEKKRSLKMKEKEFTCDLCKKKFLKKTITKEHILSHFPEEYLTCRSCSKMFKSFGLYRKHIQVCDKANKNNVSKTNKNALQCDLCKKYLMSKNGLRDHIVSHFPEDYLTCGECRKTFKSITAYRRHIRDCGDVKNKKLNTIKNELQCDLCKKIFQSKHGIRRHIFSHFPEEYLTCKDCKETFKTLFSLNTHMCYCDVTEEKNFSIKSSPGAYKARPRQTKKNSGKKSVGRTHKRSKNLVNKSKNYEQEFSYSSSYESSYMEDNKETLHGLISEIEIKQELL